MSDVRALLKAKRQEARIDHPEAVYSTSGQLRCTACNANVKHASAWDGHVGSKMHRTNVTRLKDEERRKEARREEQRITGKRKAEEQDCRSNDEETQSPKVGAVDRIGAVDLLSSAFFSDPSQALPPPVSDASEDEETKNSHTVSTNHEISVLDREWEIFQRDMLNTHPNRRETYERATVFADPVIASEVQDGNPSQPDGPALAHVDSEDARRRKEQDERELIMDRLWDEERAQEEADLKVTLMKGRLDALKERRAATKATKTKSR